MHYYLEEFTPPKEKITSWQLKKRAARFKKASTMPELAKALGKSMEQLKNITHNRHYSQFYIPKANGSKRLIETPSKELKRVLRRLNDYLQAVYYGIKPDCAYGCILSTADEHQNKNIYTNALQHVQQKWLLSIDLEDFFNNISYLQVRQVFKQAPFKFNDNSLKLLAELTTYEERLPIGAPTSPVIANLTCLSLDQKLRKLAQKHNLVYTRYLDDFSFSSKSKFKKKWVNKIMKNIVNAGFLPNMEKTYQSKIDQDTHITGLSLHTGKPDVSKRFIQHLETDIFTFHKLTSTEVKMRNIFPAEIIKSYRNSILGKLNFMKFIRGESDQLYMRLKGKLEMNLS